MTLTASRYEFDDYPSPEVVDFCYDEVGFMPTELQRPILDCRKRFILVAGGEQAGKSMVASKYLLSRLWESVGSDIKPLDEPGLYWLVAADYERTRAEFDYLVQDFTTMKWLKRATKRVDPGLIELNNGIRIETKSAKDPRTLAMKAPTGIIGCEASQLDLESFHRLRGRCAPKRGWLFLAGTFEGSLGWYPRLFQDWKTGTEEEQSFSLPSYSNNHLYPDGKSDPEILKLKAMASDDFFMERIEGIPSPPQGLVFGEFRPDLHISEDAKWVKGEPVHLWMDPGYAGAYAVEVIQEINGQICVIDEIYEQGLITKEIVDIAMTRPWWQDVTGGVIDVAGYQHQAMSAPAEIWVEETGLYLAAQKVRINEGTERLKSFLKINPETNAPKLVVNPNCGGVLSEFGASASPFDGQTRAYRWKMDRDGNIVGETPEDKNNHAVKALIYGLVDRFGYGHLGNKNVIKVKRW